MVEGISAIVFVFEKFKEMAKMFKKHLAKYVYETDVMQKSLQIQNSNHCAYLLNVEESPKKLSLCIFYSNCNPHFSQISKFHLIFIQMLPKKPFERYEKLNLP